MKINFKQLIIPIIAGVLISGGFVFATLLAPWQGGTGQDASGFTGYGYWTAGVYSITTSPSSGTVTSVAMSVPTGLSISGSPITTSGTLALGLQSGYNIPADASTTDWQTAFGWGDWSGEGFITGNETITLSGDITGSGATSIATTIGTDIVHDTMIDWGTGASQVSLDDMPDKSYFIDQPLSPMILTGGDISTGTNAGTYKISALTALMRSSDSVTGTLVYMSLAEQDNQAITASNTTYFVSLNYNDGVTPTISLATANPYVTAKTSISLGKVMKDTSDNVHFIGGGFQFQDGVFELHRRAGSLRGIELVIGSTIAYSETDNFTMTAGTAYAGINRIVINSYNSSSTQFTYLYDDGSHTDWTEALSNVIDFEHYDDGDGTLGEIANNKYGCHWVYKHADDGDVYVIYGKDSYSLAEAQTAAEPSKPDHLTDFGLLLGCIIAPQSGGSFSSIQMVTDTFFSGTSVSDHNQLGTLQGGTADEYYHLTSAQHTIATQEADTTLSGYLSTTDWDTFNNKASSGANSDITSLTGLTTALAANYGGTGVANNVASTLTISGNYGTTFTVTEATSVTLPASGTLVNSAVTTLSSLSTIGTVTSGTLSTGAVLADVTMTLGSDADGDIYYRTGNKLTRLAKGTDGHYLKQGASIPEWAAVAGGGDVSKSGTPADSQIGVWTADGIIEGTANLTYDTSNLQFTGDLGSTGTKITKGWFTDLTVANNIAGSITGNAATVTGFTPASGSLTLAGADAVTITTTGTTNSTLPLGTKTLVATDVATLSSLTSIGTIGTGTWQGTAITGTYIASDTAYLVNTTYLGGTNLTLSGTTFNVDDKFLKNDAADIGVGLTLTGDNSSADTNYVPMVLYNTDATPPTASGFPIGTLYIQYTP